MSEPRVTCPHCGCPWAVVWVQRALCPHCDCRAWTESVYDDLPPTLKRDLAQWVYQVRTGRSE